MPSELQTGKGILWGIGGADGVNPVGITGFASFILDTGKAVHNWKLTAIEDENEFDATLVATNAHKELDLTWTAAGANRAAAQATAVFLDPLSKVTLSNFKVADYNGDWIYVGGQSIDLSHTAGKISLKIRKYDDATQNAALTTLVVG